MSFCYSQIYEDTKVEVAAVCMLQRNEEVTLVKWGISTSNSEFSENKSVARHMKLQTQRSPSSTYIPKHVQQVDAGKDSRYRAVKEAKNCHYGCNNSDSTTHI
jgi:hypothetical protein